MKNRLTKYIMILAISGFILAPLPAVSSNQNTADTASATATKAQGNENALMLNFDDADLYEVVRFIAEILEINIMLEKGMSGSVTLKTAKPIPEKDLFELFYQILEINGLTAVKDGDVYRITRLKEAPRFGIDHEIGRVQGHLSPQQQQIIQIIPLEHISTSEGVKLITPFLSSEGTMIESDKNNVLILVDKRKNITKALSLLKAFDVNSFENSHHKIFKLNYILSDEAKKLVDSYISAYGKDLNNTYTSIALERLNALVVVSRNLDLMERIEAFLNTYDVPDEGVDPQIFVYFVRNGRAETLSSLLSSIFNGSEKTDAAQSKTVTSGATDKKKEPTPIFPTSKKQEPKKLSGASSGTQGRIRIVSDDVRNAIIIEATPSDYLAVEKILKKLDILPRQVLIEVLIAEITLSDGTDLGVEWSFKSGGSAASGLQEMNINGDSGLTYSLGLTTEWTHALSALAQNKQLNVLSSPTVLASDNKEAKINVATQIPVASSEYVYNDNAGVTQTTIQYRDTGVILSVTPHINDKGLVSMEISQEVSNTEDGISVGGKEYPSFLERTIETSLTVDDAQTIVMGGLIRESKSDERKGVPILKDIPLIGWLFGTDSNSTNKTELVVLITPHVIESLSDVDAITEEFKKKVKNVTYVNPENEKKE